MISDQTVKVLFVSLLFIILASPQTFKYVHDTLGVPILKTPLVESGVPTRAGLVVHAAVFGLLFATFLRATSEY